MRRREAQTGRREEGIRRAAGHTRAVYLDILSVGRRKDGWGKKGKK
jgi:hypothetical protein